MGTVSTQVVNIRTLSEDWRSDSSYVYIGRAGHGLDGRFGNPFRLTRGESRGATIERFRAWFEARMESDADYRDAVLALRGKKLVCFCKPHACHGDVIAQWLDEHAR